MFAKTSRVPVTSVTVVCPTCKAPRPAGTACVNCPSVPSTSAAVPTDQVPKQGR